MDESFPPPPPWRRIITNEKTYYINDISGEETDIHPLTSYFNQLNEKKKKQTTQFTEKLLDEETSRQIINEDDQEDQKNEEKQLEYSHQQYQEEIEEESLLFRCEWKEIGLLGHVLSYGMNLLFFPNDQHFEITFDGVRACWRFSRIDGPYGPIDEDDLFIGSKIIVFDRHLTITSANSDICRMIDAKGLLLKKRISWLQAKLEAIGAVPVVKRDTKAPTQHIIRSSKASGTDNLRRLQTEIAKLCEQMGSIGIGHLVSKMPSS